MDLNEMYILLTQVPISKYNTAMWRRARFLVKGSNVFAKISIAVTFATFFYVFTSPEETSNGLFDF